MGCLDEMLADISSTCVEAGQGGNEIKGWVVPRANISFTFDVTNPSKITAFTIAAGGKQLFTIDVVPRDLDSGHDGLAPEAGQPINRFTHFSSFKARSKKVADVENINNMQDVIVFVESIDKGVDASAGDGVFLVYGVKRGLYKTSDSSRANSEAGARLLEFGTSFDEWEAYPHYTYLNVDYATSKTALEAAETPTV